MVKLKFDLVLSNFFLCYVKDEHLDQLLKNLCAITKLGGFVVIKDCVSDGNFAPAKRSMLGIGEGYDQGCRHDMRAPGKSEVNRAYSNIFAALAGRGGPVERKSPSEERDTGFDILVSGVFMRSGVSLGTFKT